VVATASFLCWSAKADLNRYVLGPEADLPTLDATRIKTSQCPSAAGGVAGSQSWFSDLGEAETREGRISNAAPMRVESVVVGVEGRRFLRVLRSCPELMDRSYCQFTQHVHRKDH